RDVSLNSARSNAPFDTNAAATASRVPAIINTHARSPDRKMSDRKIRLGPAVHIFLSDIFLSDIFLSDIFLLKKPHPPYPPLLPSAQTSGSSPAKTERPSHRRSK